MGRLLVVLAAASPIENVPAGMSTISMPVLVRMLCDPAALGAPAAAAGGPAGAAGSACSRLPQPASRRPNASAPASGRSTKYERPLSLRERVRVRACFFSCRRPSPPAPLPQGEGSNLRTFAFKPIARTPLASFLSFVLYFFQFVWDLVLRIWD